MPEQPTPGQRAYAAYWRVDPWVFDVPWAQLTAAQQAAWEAAAQAVLADVRGHAHALVEHWHAWHRDATAPALPLHTAIQVLEAWLAMHEEARPDAS